MIFYKLNQRFPKFIKWVKLLGSFSLRVIRKLVSKHYGGPVVILSLHKLGDSVFTIPAVKRLSAHFREKTVLLTFEENIPLYKVTLPALKYVGLKKEQFISGKIANHEARATLRQMDPEIIIDITGSIITAGLIFNSSAKEIVGISESQYKGIYSKFIPVSYRSHLSEIYSNVADEIGIPEITIAEDKNLFESIQGSILILPSAGWKEKEWPLLNFISLALELKKDFNVTILFPQGSIKKDITDEIIKLGITVAETGTTEDLISEIRKHDLIISNDSGPSHIAELLGKRTVTLFGPVNPSMHKRKSPRNITLAHYMKCTPVLDKMCIANGGRECPSNECMINLSIYQVLAAIKENYK
jgi:ADP-heptose:LPS heptosyltransferase